MAFSPDELARPAVELAAARWSASTGCEVTVGDGGVPVAATPLLLVEYDEHDNPTLFAEYAPGRKYLCGISIWNAERTAVERIHIALEDVACTGEDASTHELGHALSRLRRHAVDGVMARGKTPAWSPLITEQSLALACAGTACQVFEPEL